MVIQTDTERRAPKPAPAATNPLAQGVLPDPVIRDARSQGTFVFIRLADELDRARVTTWLTTLTTLVRELTPPGSKTATVACGFGPTFFTGPNGPRFGLAPDRHPAGFAELPPARVTDPLPHTDVVLYIMSTSEAVVARFLQGLAATRPALAGVTIARGFQRGDGRELAGFRDGLRNTTTASRASVVFIDRDEAPDEPDWLEFGTYGVYLRVREDLDAIGALPLEEQERIFGRRREDGSRLDLPAGTEAKAEGAITDAMPANAHTPKAGPRGERDSVAIFRRGVPYLDLASDGSLVAGLHFVSFQNTLLNFNAILNRWMLNPGFPRDGVGVDALFARKLATIERAAFFVVPPADPRFIGARIFDPPAPPVHELGRVIVHKKLVDANGAPAQRELGGIGLQVFDASGSPLGPVFLTRSSGIAMSPELPIGVALTLREVSPPAGVDPAPDVNFTLSKRSELVVLINRARAPGPYGS